MVSKETVRRVGIGRCLSRIEAEPRRAVGTKDRVRLAHIDGAFEERGRQVLARLADGERGDERGGGATAPAFPTIRRSSGLPLPTEWCGNQYLRNVRQLQVAAR
jgi:hypothetical protein